MTGNALDAVFLAVVALAVIFGAWQGLVKMAFSWASLAGAFLAAALLYEHPAERMGKWVERAAVRNALGFAGVFLAVFLAGHALAWLITKWLDKAKLRAMDRAMGAVFGLALGLTLVVLCVLLLTTTLPQEDALVERSASAPLLLRGADFMVYTLPHEMRDAYRKGRSLVREWKGGAKRETGDKEQQEDKKSEREK